MIIAPDADLDQAADALIGAGYGAAGERCMAISVAVPIGDKTADLLIEKLVPRIEKLKIGPYNSGEPDFGPLVTRRSPTTCAGSGRIRRETRREIGGRWARFQNARL